VTTGLFTLIPSLLPNHAMKALFTCLILLAAPAAGLRAADAAPSGPHSTDSVKADAPSPAALLAEQVKQIAATPDMSEKTKAKLISSAVQAVIAKAIAGIQDPAEILNVAAELAGAAAKAAPHFATAITQAVMANPAVAGIDGALAQVQSSVQAAVQSSAFAARPNAGRTNARADFGGNSGDIIVSPSF
jgi:hypothetical protein